METLLRTVMNRVVTLFQLTIRAYNTTYRETVCFCNLQPYNLLYTLKIYDENRKGKCENNLLYTLIRKYTTKIEKTVFS